MFRLLPLSSLSSSFLGASLALGLVACSGGSGGSNSSAADAGGLNDGGAMTCPAADDFGDLGAAGGNVFAQSQYLSVDVELASSPRDLFVVELFEGSAPFENGIAAGTFEISGTQTDYNTCGTCVSVWADVVDGTASMVYLAQSGTLTVTSIEGRFTGSFAATGGSSTFVGYRLTTDTSSEEAPECTLKGGNVSWDSPI
ncbi:MAG: hypothetical protein JKY56_16465 [Kofleriaceae bacterium]|nr:hypothetical protein [Kofleriaceae bacterium]